MTTPHSPLPPEPTPSLEILDAKLNRAIAAIEHTKDVVDRWDTRHEEIRTREKNLRDTAKRLSDADLKLRLGPPLRVAYVALVALLAGMAGGAIGGVLLSACSR